MNNKTGYEVLLMGMMMVQKMGGKTVKVFSDSKLVVGQVRGDLEARDPRMQEYLSQVRSIQTKFEFFDLSHIPKSGNTHADFLATLTTSSAQDFPRVILVEDLCTPTSLHQDMSRIHQIKLGPKLKKYEEKLLGFGCLRRESYISVLSLVLICFVYTLRH